ncbi:uncharacterized protein LOC136030352 isoform X2 [Artemia franciscana]|uniref:uncharacterized protein LOC136030352 isoform X2 n=1 Tax=Artemia franciscana TaxID=6661 RepID=UPI0032DA488B
MDNLSGAVVGNDLEDIYPSTDEEEVGEAGEEQNAHGNSLKSIRSGRTPNTTAISLNRGSNGFGFSVSSTKPPRIQAIEHGAPADEAGLKIGDYVIFVGTKNVVKMDKDEVLRLLKSSDHLMLEVYRRPPSLADTPEPSSPSSMEKENLFPNKKCNTTTNLNIVKSRSDLYHTLKTEPPTSEISNHLPTHSGNLWIVNGRKTKRCWAALYDETLILSKYCGNSSNLDQISLQTEEIVDFESVEYRILLKDLQKAYFNIKKRDNELKLIVKVTNPGIVERGRKVITLRAENEQEKNFWQAVIHKQLSNLTVDVDRKGYTHLLQRQWYKLRESFSRSSGNCKSKTSSTKAETSRSPFDNSSTAPTDSGVVSYNPMVSQNPPDVDKFSDTLESHGSVSCGPETIDSDLNVNLLNQEYFDTTNLSDISENNEFIDFCEEELLELTNSRHRKQKNDDNYPFCDLEDIYLPIKGTKKEIENDDQGDGLASTFVHGDLSVPEVCDEEVNLTDLKNSSDFHKETTNNRENFHQDSSPLFKAKEKAEYANLFYSTDEINKRPDVEIKNYSEPSDLNNDLNNSMDTSFNKEVVNNSENFYQEPLSLSMTEGRAVDKHINCSTHQIKKPPNLLVKTEEVIIERDLKEEMHKKANRITKVESHKEVLTNFEENKNLKEGMVCQKARFFEEVKRVEAEAVKKMPKKQIDEKKAVLQTEKKESFECLSQSKSYSAECLNKCVEEFDCSGLSIQERLRILNAEPVKSFNRRSETSTQPKKAEEGRQQSPAKSKPSPIKRRAPHPHYSLRESLYSLEESQPCSTLEGKVLQDNRKKTSPSYCQYELESDTRISARTSRQTSEESGCSNVPPFSRNSQFSELSRHSSVDEHLKSKPNRHKRCKSWASSARSIISIQTSLSNLSRAPRTLSKNAIELAKSLTDVTKKGSSFGIGLLRGEASIVTLSNKASSSRNLETNRPSLKTVKEFQDNLYNPQGRSRKRKLAPKLPILCNAETIRQVKNPLVRAGEGFQRFRKNFSSFRKDLRRLAVNYHNCRLSRSQPLPPSVKPKPAEAAIWAESFEKLMESKYGCALFRAFLKREFSDENLDFWLAIEKYKKLPEDKLHEKAVLIYGEFIAEESSREVNLNGEVRKALHKACSALSPEDFHRNIFNLAQRHIADVLKNDAYPRFLQSTLYKELLHPTSSDKTPALFSL